MFTTEGYTEHAEQEVEIQGFTAKEIRAFLEAMLPGDERVPPNRESN